MQLYDFRVTIMREAPRNFSPLFYEPAFEQRGNIRNLTGAARVFTRPVIKMQRGKNEVEIRRLIKAGIKRKIRGR